MPMFKALRLPPKLRHELERKMAEGGHTIDQLMSFVRSREPSADVSRSALHRYARHYRAQLAAPAALTRRCMSKAMRLPLELRDELDRKIAERQLTNAELLSFVRSKKPDADISRSGLARYAQGYRAQLEQDREHRLMGTALAETLGKAADGEHGRLLSEMLRLIVFQDLRQAFHDGPRPQTVEVLKFATAIQRVASADKLMAESAVIRQEESALRQKQEARQPKPGKLADVPAEKIRRALLGYDEEDQDK